MNLLGSTKRDVDQDKDGEDVPKLQSVEVVHCNLVNNNYQQTSKVIFTFVPNKQFGQLMNISPQLLTILGTTNTALFEVWFTDQNCEPLKIEDLTCQFDANYWPDSIKISYSTGPKFRKYIKVYGFLSFARKKIW